MRMLLVHYLENGAVLMGTNAGMEMLEVNIQILETVVGVVTL
jgi:hypothetical protein